MQSAPNSHHFLSIVFSVSLARCLSEFAKFMAYVMNRKQKHTLSQFGSFNISTLFSRRFFYTSALIHFK